MNYLNIATKRNNQALNWLHIKNGGVLVNKSRGLKTVYTFIFNNKMYSTNPNREYQYSLDDSAWQPVCCGKIVKYYLIVKMYFKGTLEPLEE